MADKAVPTREQLKKLKVATLRQRLSKLSLPQAGLKDDLITRLIEHYKEVQAAQEASNEQGQEVEQNEADVEGGESEQTADSEQSEQETGNEQDQQDQPVQPAEQDQPVKDCQPVQPAEPDQPVQPAEPNQSVQSVEEEQCLKEEPNQPVKPVEQTYPVQSVKQEPDQPVEPAEQDQPMEQDHQIEPAKSDELVQAEPQDCPEKQDEDSPADPVKGRDEHGGVEDKACEGDKEMSEEAAMEVDEQQAMEEDGAGDVGGEEKREVRETERWEEERKEEEVKETEGWKEEEERREKTTYQQETVTSQPIEPRPLMEMRLPPQTTSDYYSASDGNKEEEKVVAMTTDDKSVNEKPLETTAEVAKEGKRKKKKKRRRRKHDQPPQQTTASSAKDTPQKDQVEVEYIQEDILKPDDPYFRTFFRVFENFRIQEPEVKKVETPTVSDLVAKAAQESKRLAARRQEESSDEEEEGGEKEQPKISKKKLRRMNRLSVAQLKQLVDRPDVVEMHDVTAPDPKLLIHLKSTRNTVPVPRHWCYKRKYLQGKRGIEKPPFDLPDFIKATGVMEMRQALEEKEDAKSLKQKTRERVRPKMGKLTIDYQKLHDAFFKWQTKPKMSIHGDLYYEGKEFETRLRMKKPGDLSDELRRALGMPTGLGKHRFPPPWLVAMQRYGPPPSYPNLKIPGLNSPIPEGCSFGYFVGGWGKPPVDERGRPLYGDVFGLEGAESAGKSGREEEEVDQTYWGELESEEEEEESEEEEEEEEQSPKPEDIQAGLVTPIEGLATPSGLTSIPAGLETPEMIQLRKKKIEEAMEQGGETPALYTVLPEKTASVGGAMMGSSHVYDMASAVPGAIKKASGSSHDGIEVALDPSELDLDTATMSARYEEQLREQQGHLQKEDLSDMVAEHAAKQKKRKRPAADSGGGGKATKKLKEFKF